MFRQLSENGINMEQINKSRNLTISLAVILNFILMIISIIIKVEADNIFYQTVAYPTWSILRHVLFAACTAILFLIYIFKNKDVIYFKKEFMIISILTFLLGIISIILISKNGGHILFVFKSLYFFYTPCCYVFLLINTFDKERIEMLMKWMFLTTVILYVIHNFSQLIILSNWTKIDFLNSYSPFESSAFSGYFYGFMMYFNLATDNKKISLFTVIMNIITFKRINVIFSVLFFILSILNLKNKKISSKWKIFFIFLFTIIPGLQYKLMNPNSLDKIAVLLGFDDIHGLLMGRDNFFYTVMSTNFKSSGFSSASATLQAVTGHSMEMDGLSTFMELGYLGTFLISSSLWIIISTNIGSYFLMFVFFINYLTSTQLGDTYSLMLLFLTVGVINKNER